MILSCSLDYLLIFSPVRNQDKERLIIKKSNQKFQELLRKNHNLLTQQVSLSKSFKSMKLQKCVTVLCYLVNQQQAKLKFSTFSHKFSQIFKIDFNIVLSKWIQKLSQIKKCMVLRVRSLMIGFLVCSLLFGKKLMTENLSLTPG